MVSAFWHGIAGLTLVAGQVATAESIITEDSTFYGQSPPVYPSPNGTGTGNWAQAYAQAANLVSQMTLDEKVNLTGGISSTENICSGVIPAISRLGFPGLCLSDAGNGLRTTDYVSSWPSGIHVGASWNRNLTLQRGIGMGGEFRAKGVNIALGPVVGPLGRVALSGRNWEGFSNDPYLCGALAYETVTGMQSVGVATSTKHFIGNEQETNRNPSTTDQGNVSAVSSNIDDRTLHELYLWPFQDAVKAGTGNIMCSYNRINNSYACGNSKLLNGVLKTELGFQGFVVSDWAAQHAGVATALAGMDMVMPTGATYWGSQLLEAVTNGTVPEARLDDMATRIVANWYQMQQNGQAAFAVPGAGMPVSLLVAHQRVIGHNRAVSQATLLQGAIEGHVLVKNEKGALPLSGASLQLVSVFGYSARTPDTFNPGDSSWNNGAYAVELNGSTLFSLTGRTPQIARRGVLITGGGSGANEPAYIRSPLDALSARARRDGTSLFWDVDPSRNRSYPAVDPSSDACLVVGNAFAAEGLDRGGLHDDYTDGLVLHVAAQCANTIVVLHNAGLRLVDRFADHPNVTAILYAHLPGQDAGDALVALLYGDANPSGKLPYSVPRNESDLAAALVEPAEPEGRYVLFPQSNFSEGVFIDYRALDRDNVSVRYPFGFGLSYTTFGFADLAVQASSAGFNRSRYPTGAVVEGGPADLWDTLATVTATVTNTGTVAGAEVPQLYVGIPGDDQPVRQLRGFDKIALRPGQSAAVSFSLTRRDLSTWDTAAQKWKLPAGTYSIHVGSSSRDLPLQGTLTL